MKCECGAFSTILVEEANGIITPKCDQCYYNPKFTPDEISQGLRNLEKRATRQEGDFMQSIEIILRKLSNFENREVVKETRIIFLRKYKIEELANDKGLLGELIREFCQKDWE